MLHNPPSSSQPQNSLGETCMPFCDIKRPQVPKEGSGTLNAFPTLSICLLQTKDHQFRILVQVQQDVCRLTLLIFKIFVWSHRSSRHDYNPSGTSAHKVIVTNPLCVRWVFTFLRAHKQLRLLETNNLRSSRVGLFPHSKWCAAASLHF